MANDIIADERNIVAFMQFIEENKPKTINYAEVTADDAMLVISLLSLAMDAIARQDIEKAVSSIESAQHYFDCLKHRQAESPHYIPIENMFRAVKQCDARIPKRFFIGFLEHCASPETLKRIEEAKQKRKDTSVVYFYADIKKKAVKIGTSVQLEQRLNTLQNSNPNKLTLLNVIPGDCKIESEWHKHFQQLRLHGEWFTLTDDLRKAIEKGCFS